ncbi:unnamed protein product [Adineta ricciae]|uniref:ADP-ribosylglycohydrolase n=1 Tax=Adineta ricciae TaxID=249248 RepID=A0A815IP92_ADIRI|nr:unnamed protein product [Adineta ricciae]CAF1375673.1 unnamed protein product [Adineta ricciae]
MKFPLPHEKKLPHEVPIHRPPTKLHNSILFSRIAGSLVGLAVGDALGASVEFRPRKYLLAHPVHDMTSGGTWNLKAGQWTDDTSMALCLATSLINKGTFSPYDQMVRFKWWYRYGYLSSTGVCFDIGNGTRKSLEEFTRRQVYLKRKLHIKDDYDVDQVPQKTVDKLQFNVFCSGPGACGNGALMRLAPVPLFFYRVPHIAVELSGHSSRLTHGDEVAIDACRYLGALIVAAIAGESKENLLSERFYESHRSWFGRKALHQDILHVAAGSFKRQGGYNDGIRGAGHVVPSLEAALWAFWKGKSYEDGVMNAIHLGDDTDTTAAIYGQLAGAHYGYQSIPYNWIHQLYANSLIFCIAEWLQASSYRRRKVLDHKKYQYSSRQYGKSKQHYYRMNGNISKLFPRPGDEAARRSIGDKSMAK